MAKNDNKKPGSKKRKTYEGSSWHFPDKTGIYNSAFNAFTPNDFPDIEDDIILNDFDDDLDSDDINWSDI